MSSPITISQWPDDVRAPADEAAAADGHDRVGRHLLSRRHAGRNGGARADDRLGPDVDQVLVVDGALGEEQAGPGAHAAEASAPWVVGADRPEVGRTLPGRVHQPGQGPPQRCREGAGPAHARNGRWCRRPPRHAARANLRQGAWVNFVLCSPSHRTVAPTPCRRPVASARIDRRQFLQLSALGAAGFAGATRLHAKHQKQRVPARAKRRRHRAARRRGQEAAERRHRAHGALADRRERQAGHAELDLQPRPTRPRTRGLRQPGQRGARRRRRRSSSTPPPVPSRCRPTGWATTRAWVAASSSRPTSSRPRSRPRRWSRPASAR